MTTHQVGSTDSRLSEVPATLAERGSGLCERRAAESRGANSALPATHQPLATGLFGGTPFERQQLLLAVQTPAIAVETSILPYHAVARYHHSHRIDSAGVSDSADRLGVANGARHVAIRARTAIRDGTQFFPNLPLEGGRPNVHRQIELWSPTLKVAQEGGNPRAQRFLVATDLSVWILRKK